MRSKWVEWRVEDTGLWLYRMDGDRHVHQITSIFSRVSLTAPFITMIRFVADDDVMFPGRPLERSEKSAGRGRDSPLTARFIG